MTTNPPPDDSNPPGRAGDGRCGRKKRLPPAALTFYEADNLAVFLDCERVRKLWRKVLWSLEDYTDDEADEMLESIRGKILVQMFKTFN